MARQALSDCTNLVCQPRGKFGTGELNGISADGSQFGYPAVSPPPQPQPQYAAPTEYRHDPYATPTPQSTATTRQLSAQYSDPTYYADYQQESIPPPPQLLPNISFTSPALSQGNWTPQDSPLQSYDMAQSQHQVYYPTSPTEETVQVPAPAPAPSLGAPAPVPAPKDEEVRQGTASVAFRFGRSEDYATNFVVKEGDHILVGGDRGTDLGVVTAWVPGVVTDEKMKKASRVATEAELNTYFYEIPQKEAKVVHDANEIISRAGIRMTIVDAEFQFDMGKLTLHFTSQDARTDWRPALKDLFRRFQCRIWFHRSSKSE